MKTIKGLAVLILCFFCPAVLAVTSGDRQALNYIEDANHYLVVAKNSSSEQRKLYIRKAAVAANFACRLADTPRYKDNYCAAAKRINGMVTFD